MRVRSNRTTTLSSKCAASKARALQHGASSVSVKLGCIRIRELGCVRIFPPPGKNCDIFRDNSPIRCAGGLRCSWRLRRTLPPKWRIGRLGRTLPPKWRLGRLRRTLPPQALAARTKYPGPRRVNFSSFSAFVLGGQPLVSSTRYFGTQDARQCLMATRRFPFPTGGPILLGTLSAAD